MIRYMIGHQKNMRTSRFRPRFVWPVGATITTIFFKYTGRVQHDRGKTKISKNSYALNKNYETLECINIKYYTYCMYRQKI